MPEDSVLLMGVRLSGGNIVRVDDYCWRAVLSQTTVSVMDYGAVGDGVTDDTEAFNRATGADEPWHPGLARVIVIPAGRDFRIFGTVCIRAGQTLGGSGAWSGTDCLGPELNTLPAHTMFALGARRVGGVVQNDEPGTPPAGSESMTFIASTLENIHVNVGPVPGSVVRNYMSGTYVRHCMFTNVDIAMDIKSTGVIVSDIFVDQALIGLILGGDGVDDLCQNVQIANPWLFLARRGIEVKGRVIDTQISTMLIAYPQFYGIKVFQDSDVKNLVFDTLSIVMNDQFPTFLAGIQLDGPSPDVGDLHFVNCTFRNLAGPALLCSSGIAYSVNCDGWTVDGLKTLPLATPSPSLGLQGIVGQGMGLNLRNAIFRNLYGPVMLLFGATIQTIRWDGGMVRNITGISPSEHNVIQMEPETNTETTIILSNIDFGGYRAYNHTQSAKIHISNLTSWIGPITTGGGGPVLGCPVPDTRYLSDQRHRQPQPWCSGH